MAPSGGHICDSCKWCHLVAKLNPSYGVNFWVRCASGNVLIGGSQKGGHLGKFLRGSPRDFGCTFNLLNQSVAIDAGLGSGLKLVRISCTERLGPNIY